MENGGTPGSASFLDCDDEKFICNYIFDVFFVTYYVKEGPAEIKDNRILFTRIPPRAKYPVKVTVVAWQYGKGIEPKVRSAEPVAQTFYIYKKATLQ